MKMKNNTPSILGTELSCLKVKAFSMFYLDFLKMNSANFMWLIHIHVAITLVQCIIYKSVHGTSNISCGGIELFCIENWF